MKTIVKAAAILATALVALPSCLKEQTGFSIEDVPGTAKVMGVITMNEGQAYENGKLVDLKKPAANVEVVVKVANEGLSPTGEAEGYTDFVVTTNDLGYYEIVIPATEDQLDVVVLAPSYQGTYSFLNSDFGFDGDNPVFVQKEALYSFEKEGTVSAGKVLVLGGEYTKEYLTEGFEKSQELMFTVYVEGAEAKAYPYEVQYGQNIETTSENYYTVGYSPLAKVQLEISVTADFDGDGSQESQLLSGVTGSDGYATIRFNAHNARLSDVKVVVEARELAATSGFNFWTWEKKDVETYNEYNSLIKTFKYVQKKYTIPAEYCYYDTKSESDNCNFGGLKTPGLKVKMVPSLFSDDIPQSEKDDENGWYKAWYNYGYFYSNQWNR